MMGLYQIKCSVAVSRCSIELKKYGYSEVKSETKTINETSTHSTVYDVAKLMCKNAIASVQSATKYATIRSSVFTYLHYTCKRATAIQSPNIRNFPAHFL